MAGGLAGLYRDNAFMLVVEECLVLQFISLAPVTHAYFGGRRWRRRAQPACTVALLQC